MKIIHSTKGSTWKDHKYIRKEGGKYIYPPKNEIKPKAPEFHYGKNESPKTKARENYMNRLRNQRKNLELLYDLNLKEMIKSQEDYDKYSKELINAMNKTYTDDVNAKSIAKKKVNDIDKKRWRLTENI